MIKSFEERLPGAKGFLFDLDNTLYPREIGLFDRVNERIDRFVMSLTRMSFPDAKALRRSYVDRYGTTLRGLMKHHRVPPAEYLEYVHDVPLPDGLSPDEELRDFLSRIGLPKVVFTNASTRHAERVLDALRVADQFDEICDLETTGYRGKPHRDAYDKAVDLLGVEIRDTIFIDDLDVNIKAGSDLGMITVYVGEEPFRDADLVVTSVLKLAEHLGDVPWFNG